MGLYKKLDINQSSTHATRWSKQTISCSARITHSVRYRNIVLKFLRLSVDILKEPENGINAEDVSRRHSVSRVALYGWRRKYSGMGASALRPCVKKQIVFEYRNLCIGKVCSVL